MVFTRQIQCHIFDLLDEGGGDEEWHHLKSKIGQKLARAREQPRRPNFIMRLMSHDGSQMAVPGQTWLRSRAPGPGPEGGCLGAAHGYGHPWTPHVATSQLARLGDIGQRSVRDKRGF